MRVIYNPLFQASAATPLEIARDPRHLGADRLLQRAPYLEPAIATSSSCSLCCRCWRSRFGPHTLGLFTTFVLPAGEGTQPCLPRQARRRIKEGLPHGQPRVLRRPRTACPTTHLRYMASLIIPSRLGRPCQAPFGGSGTRAALPQWVHASRRHLQPAGSLLSNKASVTFRWRDSAHANNSDC